MDHSIATDQSVKPTDLRKESPKPLSNHVMDKITQQSEIYKDGIKFIHNHYNLQHVVLGQGLLNPVVLFDPSILSEKQNSLRKNIPLTQGVACTLQYEQTLSVVSRRMQSMQSMQSNVGEEKRSSIPLCLACCTSIMTYPSNELFIKMMVE